MPIVTAIVPICVASAGGLIPAYAKLHYNTARDPFSVDLDFAAEAHLVDGQTSTHWIIGRELMRSGLTAKQADPAGHGDVQCSLSDSGVNFLLGLRSPFGEAEILFPLEEMQSFLNNVYSAYPSDELSEAELDNELAALIDGGEYR